MKFYWLSFCDPDLPKGTQFLGAVFTQANDFIAAVRKSHALGINPGGEVQGHEAGPRFKMHPSLETYVDRVLTREECEAFESAIVKLFGD